MIPRPKIENDRFELNHEYIACWKWTCPTCGEFNYSPSPDLADGVYIKHAREEHPELQS